LILNNNKLKIKTNLIQADKGKSDPESLDNFCVSLVNQFPSDVVLKVNFHFYLFSIFQIWDSMKFFFLILFFFLTKKTSVSCRVIGLIK